VNGIRVLRRGVLREEIVLEMELCLESDAHFRAQGAYGVSFGVRDIEFCCRARLTASPLFREWPAVGGVTIQLIQMPRLHFETTGCISVLNFSPLSFLLKRFLFAWLGRPQLIRLNVSQYLPTRARRLTEPRLLIKIDVLEALNLPFGRQRKAMILFHLFNPIRRLLFGTSGLQVELVLADQRRRTRALRACPHPEWTQNFMFISERVVTANLSPTSDSIPDDQSGKESNSNVHVLTNSTLQVHLMHLPQGVQQGRSKDTAQILGSCHLPINCFHQPDSTLNGREFEAPLHLFEREVSRNPRSRFPTVAARLSTESAAASKVVLRVSCLPLTDDRNALQSEGADRLVRANWPLAVLTVLVDSASGLETAARYVRAPELRPLVRVSVGNQQMVTSVQERTAQPVWEQTLQFYLYNPKLEEMLVEVI
jgi:hypothetical protein